MRSHTHCVAITLALISFASTRSLAANSTFIEQVRANFAQWDTDHDGALSANEIEKAVDDPAVKGPAAAAAAALRRAIRANSKISPLTLERITAQAEGKSDSEVKSPLYDEMYESALAKIEKLPRALFVSGLPRVETLGQGRLGDCFLLAPLGTVASRQPERLKKMVTETPDGQISVHFGNGDTVTLPPPTDAEVVIGAGTLEDGVWANVFEKSIGHIYLDRQKKPVHVTPYSIIGVGGSPASPFAILTGHRCKRVGCENFQKGGLSDPKERETRLEDIRKQLEQAFATNHMIVGGTGEIHGGEVVVPGLYYDHSYGVLNYDRKTDLVTFWNPMGNAFKPHGEPGLEHGYSTSHGRFDCPLKDAVMWFGSFSIETDEPVEKS